MRISDWFNVNREAVIKDWEKDITAAVETINKQNWIRYEITQWDIRFQVSGLGKTVYVSHGKEGIIVHITIIRLKDKYNGKSVSKGGLTEADKSLAGYLKLFLAHKDLFSDWTFKSEVNISSHLF